MGAMPDALEQRVRSLMRQRAGDWPGGATPEAIEQSLGRFERELIAVVAAAAKAPAAAASR